MKKQQHDYTGKTVYVGIDVHKKTYCCVTICEGDVVKKDSMPAKPKGLVSYLKKTFINAHIKTVYEAGFSGFHLHRFLISKDIENIVVNPGSIEVASRDRVKTDKRDALKMATQLSNGRLQGIFVPSIEREAMRMVTTWRSQVKRAQVRVGHQLKSLLFTQGLVGWEDDTKFSKKWIERKIEEIKQQNYPADFIYVVQKQQEQWLQLGEQLVSIEKRLKEQAQQDIVLQTIYESVPGIGLLHGRQLANRLGDMKQFNNEKGLFSFTGLTPSEYSSGENVCQGNISRQGNPELRAILIEASWVIIRKDPNLQLIFERIAVKGGKKRAIVAVARRLIGRIRSCILNGTLYEIKPIQEIEEKAKKASKMKEKKLTQEVVIKEEVPVSVTS